jgi:hypothetical protein
MYNVFNMAPVKGIATRYAKKCVCNKFFGAVVASNLTHWSIDELR